MSSNERLALVVAILASFVAFLDGSVVNVALPAISEELGGGTSLKQWVVDAYLITLGALMLTAGSLSDLFGRKKILAIGLWGFGLTSVLCAAAPSGPFLIVARALQGIAGALLVPSSLAIIISVFSGNKQGKAIGSWTAWTGMAFIVGPLLGGLLVDAGSWRLIFAINILPILVTLWLMKRLKLKEQFDKKPTIDVIGALLGTVGLGAPAFALIEQPNYGWSHPLIYGSPVIGAASLLAFLLHEQRTAKPMLPLELFKVRNFSAGNLSTVAVYGSLGIVTFMVTIFVQQVGGYSAFEAGLTLLPVTLIMFVLSPRIGALADKYGPRIFMTSGPIICAAGVLWFLRVTQEADFLSQILPGVLLFGIGLSVTVAPLTSAILGSIDPRRAGIGSAVNNALARIAGLVTIATLGFVIGPEELTVEGFHRSVIYSAILLALGGIISAIGIRNLLPKSKKVTAA